jgi:hypothetical protein
MKKIRKIRKKHFNDEGIDYKELLEAKIIREANMKERGIIDEEEYDRTSIAEIEELINFVSSPIYRKYFK